MIITVQELIEKLQGFPANSVIALEDLYNDVEFFIASFNPGDNRLTIGITDQAEEDEEV
jgi:hypothetical protein